MKIPVNLQGSATILIVIIQLLPEGVVAHSFSFTMIKSFFGLDLKLGGKVILLASVVENVVFYILSQLMLIESKVPIKIREFESILLHQDGLEHQEKFCELLAIQKIGNFS